MINKFIIFALTNDFKLKPATICMANSSIGIIINTISHALYYTIQDIGYFLKSRKKRGLRMLTETLQIIKKILEVFLYRFY